MDQHPFGDENLVYLESEFVTQFSLLKMRHVLPSALAMAAFPQRSDHAPSGPFSADLSGRMDRDFGFWLMKENTKIHVWLHVNIGSQFQAEIPNLQDRSRLQEEEEGASLVWKPWGDIETNPETQEKVTNLLNVASSNVMPGGRANLELALHCLHETQGDVPEALQMLLSGAPQRPASHPLADYHYAGSDTWTRLEQQLFKEAFSAHKKNFHLIQKKIQTKTVSQCVEYYYTWKKHIRFSGCRALVTAKKLKRSKDEAEEAEAGGSPKKRRRLGPQEDTQKRRKSSEKRPRGTGSPSRHPGDAPCWAGGAGDAAGFPCRQCGRVFGTVNGRNAHMKYHRPREDRKAPDAFFEGGEASRSPDGDLLQLATGQLPPQPSNEVPFLHAEHPTDHLSHPGTT